MIRKAQLPDGPTVEVRGVVPDDPFVPRREDVLGVVATPRPS